MQKLSKRTLKVNTPMNAPQVCGSVVLSLNSLLVDGDSEQNLKTSDNNSDEALILQHRETELM